MNSPLRAVYQNSTVTNVLPSQAFCEGYIFAIAAAPEIPMPEQWMPGVIKGSNNSLSTEQVDELAEALMSTLRDSLMLMRDGASLLPDYVVWSHDKQKRIDAEQWLTGLLAGHQFVEDSWQRAWQVAQQDSFQNATDETPTKRLTRCLKLFSSLADVDLALHVRTEEQAQAFHQNLPALYNQLPFILKEYVALAGELAKSLPNQFETFQRVE
ncbi:UPF0149 family protein [Alteromonas sp. ASW11-130]|uniref:UPF0149 family protein n=1 Tax=Alteromonas sp. ASW11-130 TaxID=3015775 RepID=UPI0022428675|nr:YecA family protein [Alteromonas sp. ASW11-130]